MYRTTNMKPIPQAVIKAAESRKDLGGTLQKLCKFKREEVYSYVYDEEMTIGMPELYLWNGKRCKTIDGDFALTYLAKLPI